MREKIDDFIDSIKEPESFRDIHLLIFILQAVIVLFVSYALFSAYSSDNPQLITEKGTKSSFFTFFDDGPVDKTICYFPTLLNGDEDNVVHTDKILDLKNGGLWLSERQQTVIICWHMGAMFSSLIFLLLGLGRAYKFWHDKFFSAMSSAFELVICLTGGIIIMAPVAAVVFGAVCIFFGWIVSIPAFFIWQLQLLLHLVLGIYQVRYYFKKSTGKVEA